MKSIPQLIIESKNEIVDFVRQALENKDKRIVDLETALQSAKEENEKLRELLENEVKTRQHINLWDEVPLEERRRLVEQAWQQFAKEHNLTPPAG